MKSSYEKIRIIVYGVGHLLTPDGRNIAGELTFAGDPYHIIRNIGGLYLPYSVSTSSFAVDYDHPRGRPLHNGSLPSYNEHFSDRQRILASLMINRLNRSWSRLTRISPLNSIALASLDKYEFSTDLIRKITRQSRFHLINLNKKTTLENLLESPTEIQIPIQPRSHF